MTELEVIEDPGVAAVALDPIRSQLLAELQQPASAASLAARVGIPRQKVNYHLRTLEAHGLVRVAEERRWGGLTERLLQASSASYVVSPGALGASESRPEQHRDRLAGSYLIALAARVIREVAMLCKLAEERSARLPSLAIDTEICFRSAKQRAAFTRELTDAVLELSARYHEPEALGGRQHRLVLLAHPVPPAQHSQAAQEAG